MNVYSPVKAFSLLELLVAICIVVIVATIAFPIYISIQSQADATTAQVIQSQLNATYANWKDSGGIVSSSTGSPYGSTILYQLYTSIGGPATTVSAGWYLYCCGHRSHRADDTPQPD